MNLVFIEFIEFSNQSLPLLASDPHSSTKFINMHYTHKAFTNRWPPSAHVPSMTLPQDFDRIHPKWTPDFGISQLPDHLYLCKWCNRQVEVLRPREMLTLQLPGFKS